MTQIRAKAPLRLGLAGGGTDVSPYCEMFGGAVLNATIDMFAYCFLTEMSDERIVFESRDYDCRVSYEAAESLPLDGELDLFKVAYNRLMAEFGPPVRGFRLLAWSDAPYGSGLGGSSTLVVALIRCLSEWWGLPLDEYDIARLAYQVERIEAGLKGGRQDQYAAACGGFNYMEFFGDHVVVNPLRIKEPILNELQSSLLLCFTGRSRDGSAIIESQIAQVTSGTSDAVAAMHRVKRDAYEMKEAILLGDLRNFTELVDRTWKNKKQMAGRISNSQIDDLYAFAKLHGARAGKVSGAGGGGFMMFCVDPCAKYDLRAALVGKGFSVTNVVFTKQGAQSWTAVPVGSLVNISRNRSLSSVRSSRTQTNWPNSAELPTAALPFTGPVTGS